MEIRTNDFFFHELRCIRKTSELAQPTSECFMHRNEFDIVQSETRTGQLSVCVKYRELYMGYENFPSSVQLPSSRVSAANE